MGRINRPRRLKINFCKTYISPVHTRHDHFPLPNLFRQAGHKLVTRFPAFKRGITKQFAIRRDAMITNDLAVLFFFNKEKINFRPGVHGSKRQVIIIVIIALLLQENIVPLGL